MYSKRVDTLNRAFSKISRANFVPDDLTNIANLDISLPIGFGQTISQPSTVKMMLEWLEVEPGNKILDIGSGSGWTTALLANLTGQKGRVYAVERIPELLEFGQDNCLRLGIKNVKFFKASKTYGLPKFAPYDRILVSADAHVLPPELVDQLKTDGKMVIPIKYDILEIAKNHDNSLEIMAHPGFIFVPLV